MAGPNDPGPVCLYKDGEVKTFHGGDVDVALGDGWLDHPVLDASEPLPNPVPDMPVPLADPKTVQVPMEQAAESIPETQAEPDTA